MCKKSGKSVDHIFLHFAIASAEWNTIFGLVGLAWAMPNRLVYIFAYWRGQFGRIQNTTIWKMVSFGLMWRLWMKKKKKKGLKFRRPLANECGFSPFSSRYFTTVQLPLTYIFLPFHVFVILVRCISCIFFVYLDCV
jgi:hypothetical protein